MEKVYIASDHAAFETKSLLIEKIQAEYPHLQLIDLGCNSNERCDYPFYAAELAKKVQKKSARGILLCGSGIGVSMVANRFCGVRAALCRSQEDAKLSREHNDSNVICFGARVNSVEEILQMFRVWKASEFEGGRHQQRLDLFQSIGERA